MEPIAGAAGPSLDSAAKACPLPEIYFDSEKQSFWGQDRLGGWTPLTEKTALMRLDTRHGIAHCHPKREKTPEGEEPKPTVKQSRFTPAEHILDLIRDEHKLLYAGRVAGRKAGIYKSGGGQYLVTQSLVLPTPEKGSWEDIQTLAERMFGKDQLPYVYGWHKQAALGLYREVDNFSQVFFMAGPAGCGKSFWQHNIITPLLGGNSARPIQYMTGGTTFNMDLIGAEHWMLEDDHSKRGHAPRRELGTSMKNVTANKNQRAHAKGRNGFVVQSRHWVSGSINDEGDNMSTLPELDDSITDKLMLLWCKPAINNEWPGPNGAVTEMEARVKEQVPAFVYWLLNEYVLPEEFVDYRFGVKAFQNPELVSRIENAKPGSEVEELIDILYAEALKTKGYKITDHIRLDNELRNSDLVGAQARRLFHNEYRTVIGALKTLRSKNPSKYVYLETSSYRPRPWIISAGPMPTEHQIKVEVEIDKSLEVRH